MTKTVIVTNQDLKESLTFMELFLGSGELPTFKGRLLAENPPKEEFATYNENFQAAYDEGLLPDIVDGVVYFDEGSGRAFHVDHKDVEIL